MQAILIIWATTATITALVFWCMWGRCLHVTMQAGIDGLNESTKAMREVANALAEMQQARDADKPQALGRWHYTDKLIEEVATTRKETDE